MLIGNRLKELRESKELSQGDIEKRTGLLRCYLSRVENGHTVPSVETLAKMARAPEVPLYRLCHAREAQGEFEKRTGLIRSYISRVENGHTVPSVATMEKMARALEIPLYQLLYDGEKPPAPVNRGESNGEADEWGSVGKDGRFMNKLCHSWPE